MCNNRCNGSCNRCEVVCDPCKKQPKIYYCGADIACVGVTKGEEISRAIKKIGDKLCQTVNQQNPLTYVNIEEATEEQCTQGGLVLQILQVGSDNLVSEHILCNGDGDFEFTEDIVCGVNTVVSAGESIQEGVDNVVSYFCERFENIPEPTGFIPLSGTEVGSPVTGDIEIVTGYGENKIYKEHVDEDWTGRISFTDSAIQIVGTSIDNTESHSLEVYKDKVQIGSLSGKGLVGQSYFGAKYENETYVQKKYVDLQFVELDYGDTISVGGIENTQVITTGVGTGACTVNLSTTTSIGKDITISDLANGASTHNIKIDSGVGNTILYNGVASQDITLNTDGVSVTIRKMTATQFMVKSKN